MTKQVFANFHIPHIPQGSSDLLLAVLWGVSVTEALGSMSTGVFLAYTLWKWSYEWKKKIKEEQKENENKKS